MSSSALVGVSIAGVVLAMYASYGVERAKEAQDTQMNAQVADDISLAADAVSKFLAPLHASYISTYNLNSGQPLAVPWSTVRSAIPDAPPAVNRIGQSLSLVIRAKTSYDQDGNGIPCESDPGELCAVDAYVVYSGGRAMNDARLSEIANRVTSSRGGGIYGQLRQAAVTMPNTYDAAGSATWTVSRGDFGSIGWPGSGRPMARVVIGGSTSDVSSLSRYPHPTRNTLHTNVNAAGCDDPNTPATETTAGCKILNAGDVTLASGQTLAGAVVKPRTVGDGQTVPKPTCPTGSTPDAVIGLERTILDSAGTANNGARGWLEDTSSTSWTVRIRFSTEAGEVAPPDPGYGRLTVLPFCS